MLNESCILIAVDGSVRLLLDLSSEAMEDPKGALVQELIDTISEISSISDYKCTVRKEYCNLARRLKLLIPMFEEIHDGKEPIPKESLKSLVSLKEALELAKELLRFGSEGSKIFMVRTFLHLFLFWVSYVDCLMICLI